jgi:hypothetical protein
MASVWIIPVFSRESICHYRYQPVIGIDRGVVVLQEGKIQNEYGLAG